MGEEHGQGHRARVSRRAAPWWPPIPGNSPGATASSAPSAASAATTPRSAAHTGCWTRPGWRDTEVCTPCWCQTGAAAGGGEKARAQATGESDAAGGRTAAATARGGPGEHATPAQARTCSVCARCAASWALYSVSHSPSSDCSDDTSMSATHQRGAYRQLCDSNRRTSSRKCPQARTGVAAAPPPSPSRAQLHALACEACMQAALSSIATVDSGHPAAHCCG